MSTAIQTFTGKVFDPVNPDFSQLDIRDIAHSLSLQVRFLGHTRYHYSVAQHSVYVSKVVTRRYALWGLLHDAAEAYIGDLARPLKQLGEFDFYRELEEILLVGIADHYGLEYPIPLEVHEADTKVFVAEVYALMKPNHPIWADTLNDATDYPRLDITEWTPGHAEMMFLQQFYSLTS